MNDQFYADLELIKKDKYQWEAYQATKNTVVIAGPGSGKTKVLTLKAMKIAQTDLTKVSGLACLSYSRETVRELQKRLTQYGYNKKKEDFVGTVHGFCLSQIISPFQHLYPEFGLQTPLRIAPAQLRKQIYLGILKDLDKNEASLPDIAIERERFISIAGSSQVNVDSNPLASTAAKLYEERLIASGHIDFTLMTKVSTQMIQQKDFVRKALEAKFPWLLIDEYQDLGKALHEMVLTLEALTDIKIYAVGDMDQSIYGFQGAYPDFLKELHESDDFKSIQLKYNYRSNQDMIAASIAALNPPPPQPEYEARLRQGERAEFSFITCAAEMEEQYKIVASKVIPKLKEGIAYNEIAIITGSNEEAYRMAQVLGNSGIPYYIVKWDFDPRSDIIQWLMECARWNDYPSEVSFDQLAFFWNYLLRIHKDRRIHWSEIKRLCEFHDIMSLASRKKDLATWLSYIIGSLDLGELLRSSDGDSA